MSKCSIGHTQVRIYPDRIDSPMTVSSFCATHNMPVHVQPTTWDGLCPIGKIEAATDAALARINAALTQGDQTP